MSENANKPVVKISEVLESLANGVSRKQIAKDLGLSYAAAQKHIFSHPKLKNRKTRPASDYTLVDDTEEAFEAAMATTPTAVDAVNAVDADAAWKGATV